MIDVPQLRLPNGEVVSVPVDDMPNTLLGWLRFCLDRDKNCDWRRASLWAKEQRKVWS